MFFSPSAGRDQVPSCIVLLFNEYPPIMGEFRYTNIGVYKKLILGGNLTNFGGGLTHFSVSLGILSCTA